MADQDGIVAVEQQEVEAQAQAPGQEAETSPPSTAEKEPEAPVDQAALKKLKIKTGVLKRLYKDKLSYEKEIVDQEAKIEKFKAEGKDESFMRQQINCLNESKMMIPDVQKRLVVAYEELKQLTDSEQHNPISKTKEYSDAIAVIIESQLAVEQEQHNKWSVPKFPKP